jgi:hypothetical protein
LSSLHLKHEITLKLVHQYPDCNTNYDPERSYDVPITFDSQNIYILLHNVDLKKYSIQTSFEDPKFYSRENYCLAGITLTPDSQFLYTYSHKSISQLDPITGRILKKIDIPFDINFHHDFGFNLIRNVVPSIGNRGLYISDCDHR